MARRPSANRVAPAPPVAPATIPAQAKPLTRADLGEAAFLILVTFLAYLPALHGGLIMDDPRHITRPELRSLHGLWRTWFDLGATAQYYPFLHSAFWVEYQLWGDSVLGYHLVERIAARRLRLPGGDDRPPPGFTGAWLAGLIFAFHPVCVNSVAWIAEQKSTLSAVLYLGAGLAYLNFDQLLLRTPAVFPGTRSVRSCAIKQDRYGDSAGRVAGGFVVEAWEARSQA